MLTIGELDRRIGIYTADTAANSFGEIIYEYTLSQTLWAKVYEKSGKLTDESDEMVYISNTIFYVRNDGASNMVTLASKIIWEEKTYIPEAINEIDGRQRFLEIITKQKDNNDTD